MSENELGRLPIINGVGYATRVGGSIPRPEVLDAMRWAQEHYFVIDDLLQHAFEVIGRETASPGGIVTSGAAAALTLGAAAILAGDDVEIMDRLPDTRGITRRRFICLQISRFDYDHPIRVAGGELCPLACTGEEFPHLLEQAIDEETAAVLFVWKHRDHEGIIRQIAEVCGRKEVPFLLDAAMALPPSDNLKRLYSMGPSLVALSGGKHLGGPQNSGLLFGDQALVESAWLQMVDMDVRPDSWSLGGRFLRSGRLSTPPRHGIGRGFKVGKDVIIGCLKALEDYSRRDFAAEGQAWQRRCEQLVKHVTFGNRFIMEVVPTNATGQYPVVRITALEPGAVTSLKQRLVEITPNILLAEDEESPEIAWLYPMCIQDEDQLSALIAILSREMSNDRR